MEHIWLLLNFCWEEGPKFWQCRVRGGGGGGGGGRGGGRGTSRKAEKIQ